MNSLLKKTLIAAAISGVSMTASAATFKTTTAAATFAAHAATTVTSEYFDGAAAKVESGTLAVELGREYATLDRIAITFSAAVLDPTSIPDNIVVAKDQFAGAYGITLTRLNSTSTNEIVFSVSQLEACTAGPCTTEGVIIDFATPAVAADFSTSGVVGSYPEFTSSAVKAAGTITASYAALRGSDSLETISGANVATIFTVSTQLALANAATAFDATIDVQNDRLIFTGAATADAATVNFTNTTTADLTATLNSVTYTVAGDFSWVADKSTAFTGGLIDIVCGQDDAGPADVDPTAATLTDVLTFTCPYGTGAAKVATGQPVITIDTVNNAVAPSAVNAATLPTQTFTVSAVATYNTSYTKELAAKALGEWDLNASQTFIPYMPFNDNIGQIINITNSYTDSVAGDAEYGKIVVEVLEEDGTRTELTGLGQALPGITVLAQDLRDAMVAAGLPIDGATSRYALNIIINASTGDIKVYSAYNANGSDRGYVQNY